MARPKDFGISESSQLPSFISSVSAEKQPEFKKVIENKDLTIAEAERQIADLAKKLQVSDQLEQFEISSNAEAEQIKKEQKEQIEKLSSVFEKLDSIYANKDQTLAQQEEAIDKLLKSNEKLIPFIQSTSGDSQSRIKWPKVSCILSF